MSFVIYLGEVTLDVADVWPDGGAPENPTAADVADVMRAYGGGPCHLASAWNLLHQIEVTDGSGRTEVVR